MAVLVSYKYRARIISAARTKMENNKTFVNKEKEDNKAKKIRHSCMWNVEMVMCKPQ